MVGFRSVSRNLTSLLPEVDSSSIGCHRIGTTLLTRSYGQMTLNFQAHLLVLITSLRGDHEDGCDGYEAAEHNNAHHLRFLDLPSNIEELRNTDS